MEKLKAFLFQNTSTRQTLAKNTFWLFLGEMGVRLCKIILFIYAARNLSILDWGTFSYAIALMAIFALISDIGVNAILIRERPRHETYGKYIVTGFVVKFILSLIAALIFFLYGQFIESNMAITVLLPYMAGILFLDSLREFGYSLNRAFEKMEAEAIIKIITTLTLVSFAVVFINKDPSAISLVYAYLISSTLGVLVGYIYTYKQVREVKTIFDKTIIYPLLKEAWPIGLVGIFGVLLTNLDTVLLGWLKNSVSVGIYSVAQKLAQVLYMLPNLLSIALLPILSRLIISDRSKMRIILLKSINKTFLITIPTIILIFIFGKKFIFMFFGDNYLLAAPAFTLMSLAILISAPGAILSSGLFADGHQKKIAKSVLVGVIANIVLCFILIPISDFYGAALSATIAQFISNGLIYFYAKKYILGKEKTIPRI